MTITARFSRNFYNQLGDEVAQELVDWFNKVDAIYRSELRAYNDLNHSRFEARLNQGLDGLEAQIDVRLGELEARMGVRLAELEARMDVRLVELEARFDVKLSDLEARISTRLAELEARIDVKRAEMEARMGVKLANMKTELIERMDARFDQQQRWFIGMSLMMMAMLVGLWFRV